MKRGHGEHRRADSTDAAEGEQLRIAAGDAGQAARRLRTMKMPVAMMIRSLKILISQPQKGLEIRRMSANAEMTAPTSVFPTPKLRAKTRQHGNEDPEAHSDAERDEAEHVNLAGSELRAAHPPACRVHGRPACPPATVCPL